MAHTIDVERVAAVLLDDGWHFILPGSFHLEDYSFTTDGGASPMTAGFTFTKVDQISREVQLFTGPLASLLAVRHAPLTEVVTDQ